MADGLLPFVDVHQVEIEAPADLVWEALLSSMPSPRTRWLLRGWAALWRAEPCDSNGLAAHVLGAERAGFEVCEVVRQTTYALAGRHRFARYQLVFTLGRVGVANTRLGAETFAEFPGSAGRVYETMLIRTGAHAATVRYLLWRVRQRAETAARHHSGRRP